jgi:hypothetical protein
MTRKLAAVFFLLSFCSFGAYQYYLTESFYSTPNNLYGNWYVNGEVAFGGRGLESPSATGGSLIHQYPVPTPNVGYEVKTRFALWQSGGIYTMYLNASNDALSGPDPRGSYYAIELQNPTVIGYSCSATLAVYKRVNSSVTLLSSGVVSCAGRAANQLFLRAIRRPAGIFVLDEWDNYLV